MVHNFDVLIVGAGAAGLMCAIEAGKGGRRVAVLEHSEQAGKKILISGGGRCNFTHTECRPQNFISANPHFAKSALARYTPADFVALVEKHRIPYHEKTRGQLFCDRSARDILEMLQSECHSANAQIFLQARIAGVAKTSEFVVRAQVRADACEFRAPVLVVATGGLSIPKMGATALGYDLARQFDLRIQPTRPALVPLLFSAADCKRYCELAGVAAEATVRTNPGKADPSHAAFTDKMLITHRGLSGPAILQISSYWQKPQSIVLDLAPDQDPFRIFDDPETPRTLANARAAIQQVLPIRLANRWLDEHASENWTNAGVAELTRQLHAWVVDPTGTEGYAKAEVTAGGVDTSELSAKTMESTKVKGLFFVGEVVDVTGQLGGFNFQWAWASGAAAGRAI